MIKIKCLQCKKWFCNYPSNKRKFCSNGCRFNGQKGHPTWNKGKTKEDFPQLSKTGVKKGNIPWNKGLTFEQDKRIPRPWLGKIGFVKEKNPNWQGGITEKNWDLRKTTEYLKWRKNVLERDKHICQICGEQGNIVDHIKPFCLYVELRLDLNNGRTVCKICNNKLPTHGGKALKYEQ